MTRFEDDIARNTRKVTAGAFSVLASGGTEAEARGAFEAGLTEYREWAARHRTLDRATPAPAVLAVHAPRHSAAPLDAGPATTRMPATQRLMDLLGC